jgi:DNA repair ATPase RecN
MDQRLSDVPEAIRKFAPKDPPPKDPPREDPTDEAGRALIAMLQQANEVSNEARERTTRLANKLGNELRAVEDRIKELEAVISHYRERARIAEEWLQRIEREIEDKLIAPQAASRKGLPGIR